MNHIENFMNEEISSFEINGISHDCVESYIKISSDSNIVVSISTEKVVMSLLSLMSEDVEYQELIFSTDEASYRIERPDLCTYGVHHKGTPESQKLTVELNPSYITFSKKEKNREHEYILKNVPITKTINIPALGANLSPYSSHHRETTKNIRYSNHYGYINFRVQISDEKHESIIESILWSLRIASGSLVDIVSYSYNGEGYYCSTTSSMSNGFYHIINRDDIANHRLLTKHIHAIKQDREDISEYMEVLTHQWCWVNGNALADVNIAMSAMSMEGLIRHICATQLAEEFEVTTVDSNNMLQLRRKSKPKERTNFRTLRPDVDELYSMPDWEDFELAALEYRHTLAHHGQARAAGNSYYDILLPIKKKWQDYMMVWLEIDTYISCYELHPRSHGSA